MIKSPLYRYFRAKDVYTYNALDYREPRSQYSFNFCTLSSQTPGSDAMQSLKSR